MITYLLLATDTDIYYARETYVLHKYNKYLVMCFIIHIIILILADDAFKEEYSTVNVIYNVKIYTGI